MKSRLVWKALEQMRYMPATQRYRYLLYLSLACTSPITKPHIDFIIMVSAIHCE